MIERHIPVPRIYHPPHKISKYMILNKLEVGESVFFPGLSAAHLRAGAAHKQRQHGHKIKFVVRTVEGGSRVWRVQ